MVALRRSEDMTVLVNGTPMLVKDLNFRSNVLYDVPSSEEIEAIFAMIGKTFKADVNLVECVISPQFDESGNIIGVHPSELRFYADNFKPVVEDE